MRRVRVVPQAGANARCAALEVTGSQKATLQANLQPRLFREEHAGLLLPVGLVRYGRGRGRLQVVFR